MRTFQLKLAALAIFASVAVKAQTATPHVTQQQVQQHKEIKQGVKSGELTKKEARHLKARQRKIQNDKKHSKQDGVVSAKERAKLNRELHRSQKEINKKRSN